MEDNYRMPVLHIVDSEIGRVLVADSHSQFDVQGEDLGAPIEEQQSHEGEKPADCNH